MKKSLLWMLAAILFCGATAMSCSKDDDNNKENEEKQEETKKYDITLALLTFPTMSTYIDYEFSYTDHNGKKSTPVTYTGFENGESLTAEEATYYKTMYKKYLSDQYPESMFLEYKAFHVTIKDVPEGSTISYETIQRTAKDATAPTEAFSYLQPCVIATWKIGSNIRNKMDIGQGIVGADKLDRWFETLILNREGRSLPYASGSIIAGSQF